MVCDGLQGQCERSDTPRQSCPAERAHALGIQQRSLGGAVAEVIARRGITCVLRTLGHQDRFLPPGIPEDLMHLGGFDEDGILAAVCALRQVSVPTDEDWSDA